MNKIYEKHIGKIIEYLKKGEEVPEYYKEFLFPTVHKEYQLAYSGKKRKEDILADNEESKAVPFQVEKVFNGERKKFSDDWQNLLIFGDNLQILKTFYRNEDELIKDRIKGKVKLIYIDPPFGTGDEYDGNKGQSAYTAKRKGADFVEFIRERLIVAREILAEDGVIFVRQGYNFGHYIKIILDEVFGKNRFINEITVNRGKQRLGGSKKYSTATDTVFFYSKGENYFFNGFKRARLKGEAKGTNMLMKGWRNPPERTFIDPDGKRVLLLPPKNQHWKFIQPKIDAMYEKGLMYLAKSRKGLNSGIFKLEQGKQIPVDYVPSFNFDDDKTIDSNWSDISGYTQTTGYPTENSEDLLHRIITTATQEGDIVMDFFAGSGTTPAVAEKLGRRWIACDIGKLSVYTIQKRLLEIENSKDLEDSKKKYGEKCKSFSVVASGLYDLGKVFELEKEKYIDFVKKLFEIEKASTKTVGGVSIDGQKRGFYVKIFPYWELSDVSVDEEYLRELHKNLGRKIDSRFYIISPAQNNSFIGDYHEIDGVRYYFLRVPYQVIKELHKVQFKKLRQPQNKEGINDLEDSIGFHFVRPPEVKAEIKSNGKEQILEIVDFKISGDVSEEIKGFEGLAMVLLDFDSNGKEFVMDEYYFTSDLVKAGENDDLVEKIQKNNRLSITLPKDGLGEKMMVIYVDIYGNEFRQPFNLKS